MKETAHYLPFICLILMTVCYSRLTAQVLPDSYFFTDVEINTSEGNFRLSKDTLRMNADPYLQFPFEDEQTVAEIKLFPPSHRQHQRVTLLPSGDYDLIDSLVNFNHAFYRAKIRFTNLCKSEFISLIFAIDTDLRSEPFIYEVKLFPTTKTKLQLQLKNRELFIGEERSVVLTTNHIDNLIFNEEWTNDQPINYRFSRRKGNLRLHLRSDRAGQQPLQLSLKTKKPYQASDGSLVWYTNLLDTTFSVKRGKLRFLEVNQQELVWENPTVRTQLEIEMDYAPNLQLERTYRLEVQEEAGGMLLAELFTRSTLANGRVLCWLRPYDYHRRSDGYLYLKDGDKAEFITNFSILPAPKINKIELLRDGEDWTSNNTIYPGELLEIRLQGQRLRRAEIQFEGLKEVVLDSVVSRNDELLFTAKVPLNIRKNRIEIISSGEPTGQVFKVKEYQRARPFDFIEIQYNEAAQNLIDINKPLAVEEVLQDVVLHFLPHKIDRDGLYGKQYLQIEVRVNGPKNELIDTRTIDNIVICPDASSARYSYYRSKDCVEEDLNLNRYLRRKTSDLETWSSVELTIKHHPQKHPQGGYSKRIELITKRFTTFNIDVSFPAGLITKRIGEEGFGSLSSISMAMIAQFSFYDPRRINYKRPFKFGAGFLAFNAFNFDPDNTNRDVGIVGLASLYPIKNSDRSRLSFPLYLGGGYFLSEQKWFVLLGPGIRLRL